MFEGLLLTKARNLPSCFFIQFLEQLLKFLVNFTLLKYVKSQRSYGFLITKELIFGFQILDLKDHFSASLSYQFQVTLCMPFLRYPVHQRVIAILRARLKPRPNEYNSSYCTIQLWCFMKCCTRLATLLYRVLSCCILLYEVWSRSNFSLNKCCTIQHFFCFPRCCIMLYSFGHPMQLCCTLLYSRVRSRSNFPPHSFVDFVFEDMFNRVETNVAFVWPPLS